MIFINPAQCHMLTNYLAVFLRLWWQFPFCSWRVNSYLVVMFNVCMCFKVWSRWLSITSEKVAQQSFHVSWRSLVLLVKCHLHSLCQLATQMYFIKPSLQVFMTYLLYVYFCCWDCSKSKMLMKLLEMLNHLIIATAARSLERLSTAKTSLSFCGKLCYLHECWHCLL